jgi:hypothetical protein
VLDCASVDGSRDRALDFTRSGLLYTIGGGALNPGSDAASDAGTDADLALEEARDDGFDNAGGWGCAGGGGSSKRERVVARRRLGPSSNTTSLVGGVELALDGARDPGCDTEAEADLALEAARDGGFDDGGGRIGRASGGFGSVDDPGFPRGCIGGDLGDALGITLLRDDSRDADRGLLGLSSGIISLTVDAGALYSGALGGSEDCTVGAVGGRCADCFRHNEWHRTYRLCCCSIW